VASYFKIADAGNGMSIPRTCFALNEKGREESQLASIAATTCHFRVRKVAEAFCVIKNSVPQPLSAAKLGSCSNVS